MNEFPARLKWIYIFDLPSDVREYFLVRCDSGLHLSVFPMLNAAVAEPSHAAVASTSWNIVAGRESRGKKKSREGKVTGKSHGKSVVERKKTFI